MEKKLWLMRDSSRHGGTLTISCSVEKPQKYMGHWIRVGWKMGDNIVILALIRSGRLPKVRYGECLELYR